MPRKLRVAKTRTPPLPSPAWTFALLTGTDPAYRLPGWVAMYQQHAGAPSNAEVWTTHRDALVAEARAHGFEAYALTRRTPTGAGFEAWRDRFLAEHRY